ncbi:ubiquinol-cytochrome-c reductase complex assembly factor 1 [Cimex lectularius]|uniref:Ubiquinol-cytochrome c chaperone domain-containing protein n=1 Tax=Cimex lectularius TaxID=79782 RepID=A0A8I6RB61_CIMLE|nr:ubiquinol-cytochrome-c reductase complex assembly factor 1 [Cimex lectularius]
MALQTLRFLLRPNRPALKIFDHLLVARPLTLSSHLLLHQKRSVSDTRAINIEKESFLQNLVNRLRLQLKKYKLRSSGYLLYESIADHIDYDTFTIEMNLPDTFHTWFVITELHVWMLMARLMVEGEEGKFARNCLVEALWQDVSARAKNLGQEHPSIIRKQIIILNEEFQAALVSYDEGLLGEDRVLANALWRRFFDRSCDNVVLLEAMVKYVRQTMFLLDRMNIEDLLFKRNIRWVTKTELFEDLPPK